MTQRNPESWMNAIIGPDTVKVDGDQIAVRRKSINFVGATQEDDPDNDATDITVGGGGGATPGGSDGFTQFKNGSVLLGADLGVPLEYFGAVGDGVTNDQAAWTAAFAALAAGTFRSIRLGAKTYLLGSGGAQTLPIGCSITGQGRASILKTATNASVIKVMSVTRTVTGATNASPIVITTSVAHTFRDGDTVVVASVGGNTAANGTWKITRISSTTFSLDGSTGNGAYTSGGTATDTSTGNSLQDFTIIGSGGSAAQIGVQVGENATVNSCPVDFRMSGVLTKKLGWGFTFDQNAVSVEGPTISDCTADGNAVGGFWTRIAEYTTFINCSAINHGNGAGSPIGVKIQSGNIVWMGGNITKNGVGVELADGANGIHGIFSGTTINHNAIPVRVTGSGNLTAGHKFDGCHIYGGDIWLTTCNGFEFLGCTFGVNDFIFQGSLSTLIADCKFDAVTPAIFDDYLGSTSQTRWMNCTRLSDGSVPSFVADRVQLAYTFSSDANKTLTLNESEAETIIIASGTLTATRDLTINYTPAGAKSRRWLVKNNNAQTVNVKFTSGTSVAVTAGARMLIGSDGTNATQLL